MTKILRFYFLFNCSFLYEKKEIYKQSRLTIDIPNEMHVFFKMLSAELGISMKQYFIESALKNADTIEDEYLAKKAQKILKDIKSGKEKTVSFKEMKKKIGWDEI